MNHVIVDSDILSYYMKGQPIVVENFNNHINKFGQLYISRISIIEILGGLKSRNADKQILQFKDFIQKHIVLDTSENSAEISSDIFSKLYHIGKHSGNYDILIAGIAIANQLTLVTNNEKDYKNIKGLKMINWTKK
jgi:tRNA(fMet)-specific endonuclease VapC